MEFFFALIPLDDDRFACIVTNQDMTLTQGDFFLIQKINGFLYRRAVGQNLVSEVILGMVIAFGMLLWRGDCAIKKEPLFVDAALGEIVPSIP